MYIYIYIYIPGRLLIWFGCQTHIKRHGTAHVDFVSQIWKRRCCFLSLRLVRSFLFFLLFVCVFVGGTLFVDRNLDQKMWDGHIVNVFNIFKQVMNLAMFKISNFSEQNLHSLGWLKIQSDLVSGVGGCRKINRFGLKNQDALQIQSENPCRFYIVWNVLRPFFGICVRFSFQRF